ncbi:MAG: hypothetical protein SGI99_09790 [Pseudomonadota bacterium]|nr:hypothetical protein [Pseudomonadota bacterium]
MQISTVCSDAVLALASIGSAWQLWRGRQTGAALCMALIALAATLGLLRFAGVSALVEWHGQASRIAALLAFPLFCWILWRTQQRHAVPRAWEIIAPAFVLGLLALWPGVDRYTTLIGATGLAAALVAALASVRSDRIAFLMIAWAIALYAAAGLWVGSVGHIGPMLRVDVYHYLLAAANPLLALALLRLTQHQTPALQ